MSGRTVREQIDAALRNRWRYVCGLRGGGVAPPRCECESWRGESVGRCNQEATVAALDGGSDLIFLCARHYRAHRQAESVSRGYLFTPQGELTEGA